MMTAAETREMTRGKLAKLVEDRRRAYGCAKKAVASIAKKIGASPMWVRRIVGRYDGANVHAHQWENVKALYRRMMRRREAIDVMFAGPADSLDFAHKCAAVPVRVRSVLSRVRGD